MGIYQEELDKASFQHDMAYGGYTKIYPQEQLLTKYCAIRNSQVQVIQSSNVIQSNNPKYDENTTTHIGTGNISEYQQLTNELHRSITRKF